MLTVGAQFQVPNFTKKDACRDKSAVHVQLVSQRPCTSTIDCFGSNAVSQITKCCLDESK